MKLRRLAIPLIVVLAVLFAGVATTTALVAARAQDSPATGSPSPAEAGAADEPMPIAGGEASSRPALKLADQPGPKPVAEGSAQELSPKPPLDPGLKADRFPPASVQAEPSEPVPQTGDASGEGETQGTVYTWQDGDRTRRVVLQTRPAVQETEAAASRTEDGVIKLGDLDSIVREPPQPGSEVQPVFRSESGGELMTLPGGIILGLDPAWDRDTVEKFFSQNGIALERASELDFVDNGFFVETEPGFPSLELANALAEQEGVILSSPNWSREVELK